MKKCEKCNKQYESDKMFCPECGGKLTDVQMQTIVEEEAWYISWMGTILAVAGVVVMWEWNVYLGVALVVGGVIESSSSDNQANKAVSWIAGIIGAIIFIAWLFLG